MRLRVAITRSLPDAEATAARVRALGHEPVLAPLLAIIPCAYNTSLGEAQALLFTSANGVRAFPDARNARAVPVFTVGDATADAARTVGFENVHAADGDVTALAALATANLKPRGGKLLHIGGAHVAGDLVAALGAAGFTVERRVAYSARAAACLPAGLRESLDLVLFHSARAAETYVALGGAAAGLTAACLSPAVAAPLAHLPWKQLIVAPKPREDALLAAALTTQNT